MSLRTDAQCLPVATKRPYRLTPARGWSASGRVSLMYQLYIIQSLAKDWKYIGSTENIHRRLVLHNSGATKSTKPHRPFKVIYTESFLTKTEALIRERFLKKNFKAREEIYKRLGIL